jgi:adenylate kinase family enzyme
MKILIYGNSGSGKSTYAHALSAEHGLAHLDLDSIVWQPGEIAVQRDASSVTCALNEFVATHALWVIEGCYGELISAASAHCTQLVFLNPGLEVCLENNQKRPWEPHKYASPEQQNAMLANLQAWVRQYYSRDDSWSYSVHRRLFDSHQGAKLELQHPVDLVGAVKR